MVLSDRELAHLALEPAHLDTFLNGFFSVPRAKEWRAACSQAGRQVGGEGVVWKRSLQRSDGEGGGGGKGDGVALLE